MLYSWFNSVYTEISGSSCEVQFISGQFHSDLENVIVQRCSDLPHSFLSITESTGSQDRLDWKAPKEVASPNFCSKQGRK